MNRWTRRSARAAGTAVAATTLALLAGIGTASAETVTRDDPFTFTSASTGQSVTCTIRSRQQFPVGNNPDLGLASTAVLTGTGPCANSFARVIARYRLPDGTAAGSLVEGAGGGAGGQWEPVGSDFVTEHSVRFQDCTGECTSPVRELRQPGAK